MPQRDLFASGFAPTAKEETEVVIRLDGPTGRAHICSSWPAMSRRLAKLYGLPEKVTTYGGSAAAHVGKVTSAWWTVPIRLIRFGRPRPPSPARVEAGRRLPARHGKSGRLALRAKV